MLAARSSDSISVPPAAGKAHLQAILDALVDVKPDGETPLHEAIDGSTRGLPPGSTAVLMVNPYLQESEAFESRLMALRRPAVYRVHEPPEARRLQEYREEVLSHNVPCGNLQHPAEVQRLLHKLGSLPIGPALKIGFLKALMRARKRDPFAIDWIVLACKIKDYR